MIEDLVQQAATHTGLSPQQSQSALAGCLFLIDRHGDPAKVKALFEAIPGATDLAQQGGGLLGKGGGLMAGLVSKAGGSSGAAMSDGMAMNQQLTRQGVTISDLQKILPLAMGWVKQQTGSDLLRDVLASVPGLGPLLTSH